MDTTESKSKSLYLSIPKKPPKIYLETVNPHITCNLCKGYLIDATTIVECLHSFCHSCIMKHLRCKTYCPSCEMLINKVKPNIKPDATLQAIVYKLVPGLYEKELLRRRAFYKLRKEEAQLATPEQRGEDTEHLIFGPNENISLMLEYSGNDHSNSRLSEDENSDSGSEQRSSHHSGDDEIDSQLRSPKYLQCPAIFRISNLKKFILHKFGIDPNKFCVEIMYKTIALPDYYTLMDVAYIYTWKRDAPMKFFYCVRAATDKENVALPNVDHLLQSQSEYVNAKHELIRNLGARLTDHEQLSDVDSDNRSESGTSMSASASASVVNVEHRIDSMLSINGNDSQETRLTTTTNTTTAPTTTMSTTTTTVHATNRANNSTPTSAVNGNSVTHSERTTNQTTENSTNNRTNRLLSDNKSDNQSNGMKTINEKRSNQNQELKALPSSSTSSLTLTSSPSRRTALQANQNADERESKEKVKTKMSPSIGHGRSESNTKTAFTLRIASNNEQTRIESTTTKANDSSEKSKFAPGKEQDAKAKSSAESEYDFDQHLLEVKLSEKNEFLNSFNLTPRSAGESQNSKPTKNDETKTSPPSAEQKDGKGTTPSPPSTLKKDPISPSTLKKEPASPNTQHESISNDASGDKRSENKASKRKSREPVKNVPKSKCPTPSSDSDGKASPLRSTPSPNNLKVTPLPTSSGGSSSPVQFVSERTNDAGTSSNRSQAVNMKTIDMWSQQNKNNLKTKMQRPTSGLFKVPTANDIIGKETKSETESSIIINNVQRPNQADTPRPPMTFNPALTQHFFPGGSASHNSFSMKNNRKHNLFSETEIKEIRNDDAMKVKVYGPSMSSHEATSSSPRPGTSMNLHKMSASQSKSSPTLKQYSPSHAIHEMMRKTKSAKQSNHSIDMKKLNSTGELEVISSNSNSPSAKRIAIDASEDVPMNEQNVQTLLHSSNIKFPPSLSITLTNDEIDSSPSRANFIQKKNFIEILKLPDESPSSSEQSRYAKSMTSSSPNREHSSSPIAINLVNNRPSSTPSSSNASKSNSSPASLPSPSVAIPGTSGLSKQNSFQAKYMQSLKPKKKIPKMTRSPMLSHSPGVLAMEPLPLLMARSPQKRKPNFHDRFPKKIPARSPAERLAPTSVEIPYLDFTTKNAMDFLALQQMKAQLAMPNNNKSIMDIHTTSAALASVTAASLYAAAVASANAKSQAANSQSGRDNNVPGGSGIGDSSDAQKAKYLPVPTSSKPFWAEHFTQSQKAAHESLAEKLKKN